MREPDAVDGKGGDGMAEFIGSLLALVAVVLGGILFFGVLAWSIAHPVSLVGVLLLALYGASR